MTNKQNGPHLPTLEKTRYITTVFKKSNIKVAYKTRNTIGCILKDKRHKDDKCDNNGICKLTSKYCPQYYIRQTGRNCDISYKEHIRDIKNNREKNTSNIYLIQDTHMKT